ncbi:hypothetical protein N7530_004353, partial [Penicillium desertorum]
MLDRDIFHPILTFWRFAVSLASLLARNANRPRDDNAETVMAELVWLAEQNGATVMDNMTSNLIWMFVVCVIAWKAVTFLFWLMQRLCD